MFASWCVLLPGIRRDVGGASIEAPNGDTKGAGESEVTGTATPRHTNNQRHEFVTRLVFVNINLAREKVGFIENTIPGEGPKLKRETEDSGV